MCHTFFKSLFQQNTTPAPICSENITPLNINVGPDTVYVNRDISEQEVRQAIISVKTNKSAGYDSIQNEMLKSGIDIIVPFLKHVFQYIFDNGIFPSDWSKSIIVPIHKKGDVDDCNNYRPISLTSLVSKIYRHILNQRLTKLATSLEIIPEEQAAFRKKYSTVDHIFTLYAMILKQFSRNRKLYVAFIDYKKMFRLH